MNDEEIYLEFLKTAQLGYMTGHSNPLNIEQLARWSYTLADEKWKEKFPE